MAADCMSRRVFLGTIPAAGAGIGAMAALPRLADAGQDETSRSSIHDSFPSQHPDLVREMVGASHGNFARVKELVELHPALAKASWDWGFGDHETALGAAAHVGNREIALYLIERGAPPTIFSAAMLGQLDVVRAMVESFSAMNGGIEAQRLPGPHGIPLLAHAERGGETAKPVYDYLVSIGGADGRITAVPLSDEDRARCAGRYTFGEGPDDVLIVTDERSTLWLKRGEDGTVRGLTHRGNYEFSPAGAPAVRVKFEFEAAVPSRVRIVDGDLDLIAHRSD